jgi:hypothetical protein
MREFQNGVQNGLAAIIGFSRQENCAYLQLKASV